MEKMRPHTTRIGIIGCGLIGKKRALSVEKNQVVFVCDQDASRAQALAALYPGCRSTTRASELVGAPEVDAVIVATDNASLSQLGRLAIENGKHVLLEKPGAIRSKDLKELQTLALQKKVQVRLGYNHRYHPAFLEASRIIQSGVLGPLMFLRARYGHGGRVGYDREWRADPKLSGGGELMDQGVHLIDLAGSYLGDFTKVEGHTETYYWDMPVDDNAFLSLRTDSGQTAWLHVSCTEWKNTFSFEIYGKNGKLHIEGLGGSYGLEKLFHYQMLPEMGPPVTTVFEYPRGDESWKLEMTEFFEDIQLSRTPVPGLKEGIKALEIVEKIYQC